MVRPAPDPTPTVPDPGRVAELAAKLDQLRAALTEPAALARFGLAVLDQFELRLTDLPATVSPTVIGERFLAWVLPDADELERLGPAALVEYAAVDPDRPDPGRLAAGYGVARLGRFGADRRLAYRSGGYRGRPGALLADHLIAVILDSNPSG